MVQAHEYAVLGYDFSDGAYGSIFFAITGLHGFHVILGFLGLVFVAFRVTVGGFFQQPYPLAGVVAFVWYWHFVDIV